MTLEASSDVVPLDSCLRGNDPPEADLRRGVQRAEGPLRYVIVPHEWGIKGVDSGSKFRRGSPGFLLPRE